MLHIIRNLASIFLTSYIFYQPLLVHADNDSNILTPETICVQQSTTSTVCHFYRLPNNDAKVAYGTFSCDIINPLVQRIQFSRQGLWLTGANIFSGNLFIGGDKDKYQFDDLKKYYFHVTPDVNNRFFKPLEYRYGFVTITVIEPTDQELQLSIQCYPGKGLTNSGNMREHFPQWYG